MLGIWMQYRFSLNIQRLTVLQVLPFLGFRRQIAQSKIFETLLLHFVGGHALPVRLLTSCARRIGDDEVYLRSLIRHQMSRLLVQVFLDFLVLILLEYSLKQLFEFVLPHYCLRHANKGHLRGLADVLAGIEEIVSQMAQQFVILFEEKDVVAERAYYVLKAFADFEPIHTAF